MGVAIDVWRCRVGLFGNALARFRTSVPSQNCFSVLTSFCLSVLVIAVLLLIGNVELNPGPSLKCPFCSLVLNSIESNANHQKTHSCDSNFKFTCPQVLCGGRFKGVSGLSYHWRSKHPAVPIPASSANDRDPSTSEQNVKVSSYQCVVSSCKQLLYSSYQFCKHVQFHIEAGIELGCPLIEVCGRDNLKFGAVGKDGKHEARKFGQHLALYHEGWKEDRVSEPHILQPEQQHQVIDSYVGELYYSASPPSPLEQQDDSSTCPIGFSEGDPLTSEMLEQLFAKFYLMLLADFILPEVQVQGISERMALLAELVQMKTKQTLKEALSKSSLSDDENRSILNEVCMSDVFYNIHHKDAPGPSLTSDYLRLKYFGENFGFVSPKEIPLDFEPDGKKVSYVPIEQTLSVLFKDATVQDQLNKSFQGKESSDGCIRDYYDGSVYKQRRSLSNESTVDLLIFQDGFSLTNPIGSARNLHNLIGVYFTIGNLEPFLRSKLKFIHLISLFNSDLLDEESFGLECFRPLFDELQSLKTNGISFNGQMCSVRVQFFISDNLGAHILGGLSGSFSHEYFCRYCEVTKSELQENPGLCKHFRTAEEYEEALRELVKLRQKNSRITTCRGVKQESIVNGLYPGEMHVCDPSLPPCVAHDLHEGVINWDLFNIISKLVEKGWFTLEQINRRVSSFKYAQADLKNKPPPLVATAGKLGGHAVQNWCMLRLLPFFLEGCIIDPSDDFWKLYLKLRRITEYACAPAFSETDINNFDRLIQEYLLDRKILNSHQKPKHHFLAHYPALVRLLGPLIHLWTMRYESKHSFFKTVARICKNFVNIGLTLSKRHQLYLAYISSGPLFQDSMSSFKEIINVCYSNLVTTEIESFGLPASCTHYESLTIGDILYKKGMFLLLETFNEDNNINIGQIEAIISNGPKTYFVLKVFTSTLEKNCGVFKIEMEKASLVTVSQDQLKYPVPQPVYEFCDDTCFSLKFHLLS